MNEDEIRDEWIRTGDGMDDEEDEESLRGDNEEEEAMEDQAMMEEEEDEEEDENHIVRLLQLPRLDDQDNGTMTLTQEEHGWACQLKQKVMETTCTASDDDQSPPLTPLTDMEIAQYALVSGGDVPNAMKRIQAMQAFRSTYGIHHSPEQGVEAIGTFLEQQAGLILCFDVDTVTWDGIRVVDVGALNPAAAVASEDTWRIFIRGDYYLYYTCQPTLATIRRGNHTMMDFSEFSWKQWNMELQYRFCAEMFAQYPIKFRQLLCFNTGTVANVCWSLVRRLYPTSLTNVLELGCEVPCQFGDDFPKPLAHQYLQPSLQEAYCRQLLRAKDLLSLRAKNEQLFRL
ncbi:expressed unknown protein [Seminavis robusta]|uniref:CRAL-TRIO domain-containing protein n=1 Tax=Seminavis robusta TaxID=568900 RepID=A0A9N8EG39_9STRA|nr:expressed unknown protein [Seminavis robusta]|eukprot:Sro1106_g242010.1 n/a (343) ;mRNA; f:18046-19074